MKAAVLPAVRVPNVIQLARLFGAARITHLVRRGIRLQGAYGARVRGDMPEIVALAAAGRISVTQPISRRYRLDQADEAYRTLDCSEITGRAIVVMT
jgi:D-arabinose 1-dehydrogenase-like Zn-dependent alcohol dehydrogenase